jgi:hypothetical protein
MPPPLRCFLGASRKATLASLNAHARLLELLLELLVVEDLLRRGRLPAAQPSVGAARGLVRLHDVVAEVLIVEHALDVR